jgi:hypothetical protein
MKGRKYISNVEKICRADIRAGNELKLKQRLQQCILNEDYEAAEGINNALVYESKAY